MEISAAGLELIEQFEGGQSSDGLFHAYFDKFGNVWTIGYGETEGVHAGMTWTKAQATADLKTRIAREYAPHIGALGVRFNQNQFDALCSFIWNVGPGVLSDTVGQLLRAGRFDEATRHMLLYVKAGGVTLAGLVARRGAEVSLFRRPWVEPDPHKYRRFEDAQRVVSGHEKHVRRASERSTVQEYDRKRAHPKMYQHRLERLRDNLSVLAARLEDVMDDDPGNAGLFYRRWRQGQLEGRAAGRRYV